MTVENLQALIESLKNSVGTLLLYLFLKLMLKIEDTTDDAEEASNKKRRTETAPDFHSTGPSSEP